MSDARWFEVDLDIRAAVDHFEKSIVLHQKGKTASQIRKGIMAGGWRQINLDEAAASVN